ncbi:hypothetical protein B0O99DRAFT_614696 [Bisporella sp. PMI_857]|nr:hypothetical protein B0O99DRAFT_614696 [Bisporella sp. PMI_857]
MRSQFLASLFILPTYASQLPPVFSDFFDSLPANETSSGLLGHELIKRDGNCPTNYNSCSTLAKNLGGACCTAGSVCSLDRARNVACCPIGASCTGTIIVGTATGTTGVFLGASTVTSVSATTTSGSAATPTITAGSVTYVTNQYFPFPIIPTTYSNSAACNSAYEACTSNYAACTANLAGTGFGVTIVAPNGGGVTVAPTVAQVAAASATSICSSLSQQACYGIQSDSCAVFGGGSFSAGSTGAAGRTGSGRGCVAMGVVAMGIAGMV